MDAKKQYALWRAQRLPDDLAAELAAMAGNADAIEGAFGAELHALCGLPVDFSDERGTTVTVLFTDTNDMD